MNGVSFTYRAVTSALPTVFGAATVAFSSAFTAPLGSLLFCANTATCVRIHRACWRSQPDKTPQKPTLAPIKMTVIDIRIQRVTQLYDSLDPSPLHEKALSHAVENYIVDCAGEYGLDEPLRLMVHVPASIIEYEIEITRAIHAHFQAQHAQCRRRYRRRMRQGMRFLFIGLTVLGTTLLARALLVDPGNSKVLVAISEGLLIVGWVAMWRPIEVLLFERVENHQNMALFDRLSRIDVEFALEATAIGTRENSVETSNLPAPGLSP